MVVCFPESCLGRDCEAIDDRAIDDLIKRYAADAGIDVQGGAYCDYEVICHSCYPQHWHNQPEFRALSCVALAHLELAKQEAKVEQSRRDLEEKLAALATVKATCAAKKAAAATAAAAAAAENAEAATGAAAAGCAKKRKLPPSAAAAADLPPRRSSRLGADVDK